MEYIHFKKLIHRDLKLDNVLLTKEGIAKISDFGISRFENDKSQTKTMRVGTALYMAPEVILTNNYNQKCDVFSYSIMMYQVLTNKIDDVYKEETKKNKKEIELVEEGNYNVEFKVANDPNYRPKISTNFEKKEFEVFIDLMKRCWQNDPKDRPGFNEITMTLQEIYENFNIE
jgi:serine/threonine protein kinase